MLTERSKWTIIFELYICKILLWNNRKYGVVVEGQTLILECNGSRPRHDSFEKVIKFFHIWLHFVLLNWTLNIDSTVYSCCMKKKNFPSAPLGNRTAALLWKATPVLSNISLWCVHSTISTIVTFRDFIPSYSTISTIVPFRPTTVQVSN